MSTKFEKPLPERLSTHVDDMPPLEVVTRGIPADEHLSTSPPPLEVVTTGIPEAEQLPTPTAETPARRRRTFVWALVGVLLAALAMVGIAVLQPVASVGGHMGLSTQAWQDYRAGERTPLAAMMPAHMGLTTRAWADYRTGERAAFVNPDAGHMGLTTQAWADYRTGEQAA